MITVDIVGLRTLKGLFAKMTDGELVEIQLAAAEDLAKVAEEVFRRWAPRSQKASSESGMHFYQGLTGHAEVVLKGFTVQVETDNPKLRGWLKHGTGVYAGNGRIFAKSGGALGPITGWAKGGGGPFWFRSIAGMPANPWEDRAAEEVFPLLEAAGRQIGKTATARLTEL